MEKDRTKHSNSAAFDGAQTPSDKGFYDVVPQSASFDENCFVRDFNAKKPKADRHEQDSDVTLKPWRGSAILLMDLDAFFASVEQLDHPEWRGKPVIVGGSPTKRGVVSTASYEARKFGVHSAMPSSTAARLCPQAIWTSGNFHRYREMSKKVMDILYDESPKLMQVSIDEAFLDISPTRTNRTHPVEVARRIQARVAEWHNLLYWSWHFEIGRKNCFQPR